MKLTLIVTCTDRKSRPATVDLRVGSLPHGGPLERAAAWKTRVDAATDRTPLHRLYRGEAWSQVERLVTELRATGFDPDLYVASAGLGLRSADYEAPSYGATFAARQADTVAAPGPDQQVWWHAINRERPGTVEITQGRPCMIVASESYARAMAVDLDELRNHDEVLVFGGSTAIPPHQRVGPDLGLRSHLGGTANSLNVRTAVAWVSRLRGTTLHSDAIRASWNDFADSVRDSPSYDRTPQSDAALRRAVRKMKAIDPTISKTRALRALRDGGIACEQKRFNAIFSAIKEDA